MATSKESNVSGEEVKSAGFRGKESSSFLKY